MLTTRRAAWCALGALLGCDDGGYGVRVHVPGGPDRAVLVEVSVVRSCAEVTDDLGGEAESPLRKVSIGQGEREDIGALAPGAYGLYGRAWESGCRLYAAGCQSIDVAAEGEATLELFLAAVPERTCVAPLVCRGERCEDPSAPDAGRDGGADSGVVHEDAGLPTDGGEKEDAAVDAGVECDRPEIVATFEMDPVGFEALVQLGLVLEDGELVVARREWGVRVVDVGDPLRPAELGSLVLEDNVYDVDREGTRVVAAEGTNGLSVIDVLDPGTPTEVGWIDTADLAGGVVLQRTVAYVTDNASGLAIVDVTDADTPVALGTADTPGSAKDVVVVGDYAYVADLDGGLQIVDCAVPGSPIVVGSVGLPDSAFAVDVSGTTAFVAALSAGVQSVDVNDPEQPAILDFGPADAQVLDLVVSGELVYALDFGSGLLVFDVSDPSFVFRVATITIDSRPSGIALDGRYAYVSDLDSGIQVIDLGCYAAN